MRHVYYTEPLVTHARSLIVPLLVLITAVPAGQLPAQQFTASPGRGAVLALADGRLAVLGDREGRVVVDGLVPGDSTATAAPSDIRVGDQVVRFQQSARPTMAQIESEWDAIPAGVEVSLVLRRGDRELTVRFAKPRARSGEGRPMVMTMAGSPAGAGAWTTSNPGGGANEVAIAGAHLRENDQGMPRVAFIGTHPAAATVPLRVGDVVLAIGGRNIAALRGLEMLYGRIAVGDDVVLLVRRGGRNETLRFAKPAP